MKVERNNLKRLFTYVVNQEAKESYNYIVFSL